MKNKIGEIILEDKGYSPRVESIVKDGKIKIYRIHGGTRHKVYEDTVDNFLGHIHWMAQFVNFSKIDKEFKNWRR